MTACTLDIVDLPLDALHTYLRWVRNAAPVDTDGEQFLLRKLAKEPTNAALRERLVTLYQPMVLGLAKRYQARCTSLDLLDLVQEGNLGLVLALNKIAAFDFTSGASFRTWVYAWVKGQILYALWAKDPSMVIPQHALRLLGHYQLVVDYLADKLQRDPDLHDIAQEMDLPLAHVLELHELAARRVDSLDALHAAGSLSLAAEAAPIADDLPDYRLWFAETLPLLPVPQQQVLRLKYGMDGEPPHTHAQIAALLALDPEAVSSLDRQAKARLRRLYVHYVRSQPQAS